MYWGRIRGLSLLMWTSLTVVEFLIAIWKVSVSFSVAKSSSKGEEIWLVVERLDESISALKLAQFVVLISMCLMGFLLGREDLIWDVKGR